MREHTGGEWRYEPRSRFVLAACEEIVKLWDKFMADDECMNPLDYPIDERIDDLREAIEAAKVGA